MHTIKQSRDNKTMVTKRRYSLSGQKLSGQPYSKICDYLVTLLRLKIRYGEKAHETAILLKNG